MSQTIQLATAIIVFAIAGCDEPQTAAPASKAIDSDLAKIHEKLAAEGAVVESASPASVRLRQDWKGGDAGFAMLTKLPDLQVLSIDGATISDAELRHVPQLKSLKRLFIWQATFTPQAIETLKTIPLQQIELIAAGWGEAEVAAVAQNKSLRRVRFLGELVDDETLDLLLQNPNLERLSLCSTSVTDKGVSKLRILTQLRFLHVEHTSVSDATLIRLWDDLPELEVIGAAGGFPARKGQQIGNSGED